MVARSAVAMGLLAILFASTAGAVPPSAEYRVKAAFLLNFTRFVEWPADAFTSADAPFVICVAGVDPFGAALDEIISGELVGKHPIVVRRVPNATTLPRCHLLFISRSEQKDLDSILRTVRASAFTLLVSDIESFVVKGGAIGLVLDRNRVRFEIAQNAALQQRLKVSSQLLALGKEIR